MAELGPWMITARNAAHADYLMRSRAEQRGLTVDSIDVTGGDGGLWRVTAKVADSVAAGEAARLGEDTQVLHLGIHAREARS